MNAQVAHRTRSKQQQRIPGQKFIPYEVQGKAIKRIGFFLPSRLFFLGSGILIIPKLGTIIFL